MTDVFISYAHSTEAQARLIAEALRGLGYGVWRDDQLPAHRAYAAVIDERLRAAKAVVVLWSADAASSQWVRAEADVARKAGTLVQVVIDGTVPPLPFGQIQCADLGGWYGESDAPGWRKVVESVRELAGPAGPAPPHPDIAAKAEPLLAVLAFDNLSGDPEMAYFSDGVSEEILQTVASGSDLKVIGRGSSFQFRGREKAAANVRAMLKATHVLDGSVRRSGARVRITANLIECGHETTLWSNRFDRELSDVFALQDEIAAAVAAALKVAFAPAVKAETIDPNAYNLYLKALDIRNRGLEPGTRLEVIKLLEEATALAPRFARAWVFLATMLAERFRFSKPDRPYAEVRARVAAAAETALELDPGLGAAYQALGRLEAVACFTEREALHEKALAVAPNDPTVLTNASLFFTELGRVVEALGYVQHAYNLDPGYPWVANWYANMLDYAGRFEEARAVYEKICALWPDNELITWNAMFSAAAHGDWARVDQLVATAAEHGLDTPTLRLVIATSDLLRDPGPDAQARALTLESDRLTRTGGVALGTLSWRYRLGLRDEVFELVDQASFAHLFDATLRSPDGTGSNGVIFSIAFNNGMMRDSRFPRLCAKLGLVDYWIGTDRWPDCAADGVLPYDFKAEAKRLAAQGAGA